MLLKFIMKLLKKIILNIQEKFYLGELIGMILIIFYQIKKMI